MKLKEYILSDCCKSITDGDHQAPPKSTTGIPFITISNIHNNQIDFSDTMYVPKEYYKNLDNTKVARPGDILYSVVGSFGIPVLIQDDRNFVFQRHIAILKPNANVVDARYLYYIMLSREFYKQADSVALGAAQRTISLSALRNMRIKLPSIKEQKLISDVLSVYDELIENNQKQIKLLEEAAQRLYKEWFVDLHFPGYEDAKIVDGVPEGWKWEKLGNLPCRLETGKRPKGGIDNSLKDGIPSIGAENVIGLGQYNYSSEKFIPLEFYSNLKKGKVKDRDILIYKDGAYIGRTSLFQDDFPHKRAAVNEHVFLLHMTQEKLQYYVFFTLYQKTYYYEMRKLNKNAAQPGINQKAMKSLNILIPDEKIIEKFDTNVSIYLKKIFILANQNHILQEALDRLLPKLMSGEIEI
ncbi:restriction endonuclease subunit S [uncultured Pseudoramibacter sp.]|uniref:restriction endonuclease subunit S n=1 Tax=uncultured Pseudoramibacter sp. TaxID=1623493 RepID=UPI0025E1BD5C|nr:restriction endonuclease subunit S [uncultured Pseudoramibacter sp.]